VLLAMLLDVPLSDHHIVLPDTTDEYELRALRMSALADIARSDRRGYRTFDPLPVQIEQEELFDLAVQALKDVGDLDLVGDILERVAEDLEAVDELYGWRLRPWEENFYREIDVSLFARGRPERLVRHKERCQERVENSMAWLSRAEEVGKGADQKQQINNALSEYASVLHQLHEYDEAAACFAQVLKYSKELSGKESAIAGYNRACALNRGGRKDEALRQLDRSLDRSWSSGTEDLTREWVTEDGDLASLHDDPRYKAIIQRRFDDAAGEGRPPAAAPKPKDAPK
jgi:tetratricopeptide (TPR) repeat protein